MRIARWNAKLLIFNYTITHRAGSSGELKVADCLSRLPLPETTRGDTDDEVILFLAAQVEDSYVSLEELQNDPTLTL